MNRPPRPPLGNKVHAMHQKEMKNIAVQPGCDKKLARLKNGRTLRSTPTRLIFDFLTITRAFILPKLADLNMNLLDSLSP